MNSTLTAMLEQTGLLSVLISETERFNRNLPDNSPLKQRNTERLKQLKEEKTGLELQYKELSGPGAGLSIQARRVTEIAAAKLKRADSTAVLDAVRKQSPTKLASDIRQTTFAAIEAAQECAAEALVKADILQRSLSA